MTDGCNLAATAICECDPDNPITLSQQQYTWVMLMLHPQIGQVIRLGGRQVGWSTAMRVAVAHDTASRR